MKLTRTQRSALFAGEVVKLIFDGKQECPYKVGDIEALSKNVKLEITEIRRTAPTPESPEGDHSLGYTLHNDKLGSRFLAKQHGQAHPEQYVSSAAGAIDQEAGEAVDEFSQKRITREARLKEQEQIAGMVIAAEAVLEAIKARSEEQPSIRRTLWPLRRELDRFVSGEKRKAA